MGAEPSPVQIGLAGDSAQPFGKLAEDVGHEFGDPPIASMRFAPAGAFRLAGHGVNVCRPVSLGGVDRDHRARIIGHHGGVIEFQPPETAFLDVPDQCCVFFRQQFRFEQQCPAHVRFGEIFMQRGHLQLGGAVFVDEQNEYGAYAEASSTLE